MTGVDTALLRQYVELRQRQKDRDAESKALKSEADELEGQILEQFAEAGIDSLRIDTPTGKRTVYMRRELWAAREDGVDPEAVCAALESIGLGDFVKESYNTQTLSSYLRDLEKEEAALPAELEGLVKGVERFSVRDRKA